MLLTQIIKKLLQELVATTPTSRDWNGIFISILVIASIIGRTSLVVDRDKPMNSVIMMGLWVKGYQLDWSILSLLGLFKSVFNNFYLNIIDYSMFFFLLSTW